MIAGLFSASAAPIFLGMPVASIPRVPRGLNRASRQCGLPNNTSGIPVLCSFGHTARIDPNRSASYIARCMTLNQVLNYINIENWVSPPNARRRSMDPAEGRDSLKPAPNLAEVRFGCVLARIE